MLDVSENGLRDLAVAIAALGRLPDLYELGIAANPCCASLDRDALVERISSSVPTVRVVDRVFVSPQVGDYLGEGAFACVACDRTMSRSPFVAM